MELIELSMLCHREEKIETSSGPISFQDWCLDESIRIKSAGGETVIKQIGNMMQLFLSKVGPDFERSKWRSCDNGKEIARGVNP